MRKALAFLARFWNSWIPSPLFCLPLLSLKSLGLQVSHIYIPPSSSFSQKTKEEHIIKPSCKWTPWAEGAQDFKARPIILSVSSRWVGASPVCQTGLVASRRPVRAGHRATP